MVLILQFSCDNKLQLHSKEREYIEKLKPTLNICNPVRTRKDRKKYEMDWYIKNKSRLLEKYSQKIKCFHCLKELRFDSYNKHLKTCKKVKGKGCNCP